jgi:hypothetical protein
MDKLAAEGARAGWPRRAVPAGVDVTEVSRGAPCGAEPSPQSAWTAAQPLLHLTGLPGENPTINRMLAERYKDHPALLVWHISNEYGGECHCELCQAAFRDFLRRRYKQRHRRAQPGLVDRLLGAHLQ